MLYMSFYSGRYNMSVINNAEVPYLVLALVNAQLRPLISLYHRHITDTNTETTAAIFKTPLTIAAATTTMVGRFASPWTHRWVGTDSA